MRRPSGRRTAVVAWVAVLAVAMPAWGATNTISTVAGTGAFGFSGESGPANLAQISVPAAVAVTPDGGYLISDQGNQRIRKVGPNGTITTVAGDGIVGFDGDSEGALLASLNTPNGVAATADGGFLIADSANHRVRKVTADGTIFTVAGTGVPGYNGDNVPATSATLAFPIGVAVLPDGGFLIADNDNHRVRRVLPNGVITTVAGTGFIGGAGDGGPATAAQLNDPGDVAVLPGGGFLVTELQGHRVRMVSPAGVISRVAGDGFPGGQGDGGLATNARLNTPIGVAVMPDGGFVIADRFNHRVRRVDAAGTITSIAGTGVAGSTGDGGVATAGQLNGPAGVDVTAGGDVLVTEATGHRVRLVDIGDPPVSPVIATTTAANGIAFTQSTWISAAGTVPPPGVSLVDYSWDFNLDGVFETPCGSAPAVSKRFANAGSTTVGLRVVDSLGRVATSLQTITVAQAVEKLNALQASVFNCENPGANNQPDRADCVKTFGFGIVTINGRGGPNDCFVFTAREAPLTVGGAGANQINGTVGQKLRLVYSATIRGPVAINGLYVPLPAGRISSYDSGVGSVNLGRVGVQVGTYKFVGVDLNIPKVPVRAPKNGFPLGDVGVGPGAPLLAGLKVGARAGLALFDNTSQASLQVTLPPVFSFQGGKPATAGVTVVSDNVTGFQLKTADLRVPYTLLGPLVVENLALLYNKTGADERLQGGADLRLAQDSPFVLQASPGQGVNRGFGFRNGQFDYAGALLDFPVPGTRPQIFTGVFLRSVGLSVGLTPTTLFGEAAITTAEAVEVKGELLASFATPEAPFVVPGGLAGLSALSGRRFETTAFAVGGQVGIPVPVIGTLPLARAYGVYLYPDYLELGGSIEKFDVKGVVSINGVVTGWAAVTDAKFNLEGTLDVCVAGFICPRVQAIVSSKGIGYCGPLPLPLSFPPITIYGTLGYSWGATWPDLSLFTCTTGEYRQVNPRAFSLNGVGAGTVVVPVAAGLPSKMIRIEGQGGAPRVVVEGPGGTRLEGSADQPVTASDDIVIARYGPANITWVGLRAPRAGDWTITPMDGSVPIAKVSQADGKKDAKVTGTVRGAGAKRTLGYRVAGSLGDGIVFVERGVRTEHVLGTAKGLTGSIRFTPGAGAAGARRIVALVQKDGVTLRTIPITTFRVGRAPAPPAPKGLTATRRGTTLVVTWRRVPAATRYAVTVTLRDGRTTFRIVRGTRLVVPDVARTLAGSAVVSVFDGSRRGKRANVIFRAPPPAKRR